MIRIFAENESTKTKMNIENVPFLQSVHQVSPVAGSMAAVT